MKDIAETAWNYEKPEELDVKMVDSVLQELVYEINQTDWLRTTCSCAGHPNSESVSEWSSDLELTLVYDLDANNLFNEWIRLSFKDCPTRYEDRKYKTRIGTVISGNSRDSKLNMYSKDSPNGWGKMKIVYEYETVGERDVIIDIMREALREVADRGKWVSEQ